MSSDLDSVKEDKQRVHDILLRADLLGLMSDKVNDDKGVFTREDYDVTGTRRPMAKSASTSLLSTGKDRRRRLRPKSAGRTRSKKLRGSVSSKGVQSRPQSASRSRRRR